MSRTVLIASLAGAVALGLSALTAQAASVPINASGMHAAKASLVKNVRHYRHYRLFRFHRYHRRHRWL